jgi:hypothetical protein
MFTHEIFLSGPEPALCIRDAEANLAPLRERIFSNQVLKEAALLLRGNE